MRTVLLLLLLVLASCARPAPTPPPVSAPAAREVGPLPSAHRPPAVRGGSLLVTRDGRRALLSDPDRDSVVIVDLTGAALALAGHVDFEANAGPGRLVEDPGGRVHVVLRGAGAVASIDPESSRLIAKRSVCDEPRGAAWDPGEGRLLVACVGGRLLGVSESRVETIAELGPDLRDVVVDPAGGTYVTRFRSAELIALATGAVTTLPNADLSSSRSYRPTRSYVARVAWRARNQNDGGIWLAHQRHLDETLRAPLREYYGEANGGAVKAAFTFFEDGRPTRQITPQGVALAVDIAPSADGSQLAVAYGSRPVVAVIDPDVPSAPRQILLPNGRAVGVAWLGERLLVQQRTPAGLSLVDPDTATLLSVLVVGEPAAHDDGHEIFHQSTASGVACASCHPEGADDGHVWDFAGAARRTPALRGGILATAPFHWNGEHTRLEGLMSAVFVERMGGTAVTDVEVQRLGDWLDEVPALREMAPRSGGSPERGEALFRDAQVGCARCHSGLFFTDNRSHDVGTGGFFQTPTLLGLFDRAPYFHDGRAATLEDRFTRWHTERHGSLRGLSPSNIRDLVAYLETL